jgi:hypothetical protein
VPITDQHRQELLSVAYAYAVAAKAGMNVVHERFDYGVDITYSYVQTLRSGKVSSTGYDLKFQLKASMYAYLEQDSVVYDLDVKAYNKLCTWKGNTPCYLLVMRQPRDWERRLEISEDLLSLRDCCYWHKIPQAAESENHEKLRIRISRRNQFTAEALMGLMDELRNGVHA